MNTIRQLLYKGLYRYQNWLKTRYGGDILSRDLLILWFIIFLISKICKSPELYYLAYFLLIVSILRKWAPSASYAKRQKELQLWLSFLGFFSLQGKRLKDLKHKYVRCPQCKKVLRVPRKKGKIIINCPTCNNKIRTKS